MILHIFILDKFTEPFYAFLKSNFGDFDARHQFYIYETSDKYATPTGNNIFLAQSVGRLTRYAWLIKQMNHAEKIILHGLWIPWILGLLVIQPWCLKKCYWVIWRGDLYTKVLSKRTLGWWGFEILRRIAIRNFGHIITYIRGDYELAQKWYGAKGEYHDCLMYPNSIKIYVVPQKQGDTVNILVGNSADPTNNHAQLFEKLKPYKDQNIKIFCPLSYGDVEYAERMTKLGKELFGDKFTPLLDFIPYEKYLDLLGQIDIAVFAHPRQQAMGNTIILLGLGKKVYMRSDVTPWQLFSQLGVRVFDVEQLEINCLGEDDAKQNKEIISDYFSDKKLIEQHAKLFYGAN